MAEALTEIARRARTHNPAELYTIQALAEEALPPISPQAAAAKAFRSAARRTERGKAVPEIDWLKCDLVEIRPDTLSGEPVLKGTRLPVSAIMNNAPDMTPAEIASAFEAEVDQVQAILNFAESQRAKRKRPRRAVHPA
jgi:uncharacterized protein (DUF433 family)